MASRQRIGYVSQIYRVMIVGSIWSMHVDITVSVVNIPRFPSNCVRELIAVQVAHGFRAVKSLARHLDRSDFYLHFIKI